jgi:hypothetical protein
VRTQLKREPSHREGVRLLAALKARGAAERQMFGGLFERAQQGSGPEPLDEADAGLYSDNALAEEARKRKEEKERLLKLENLAKLPTEMWAETFGDLEPEQRAKLIPESKELAAQMPDGGWAKAAANLTPEAIEQAKAAVELHRAREELKKQGLLEEEEEEGEEEDGWEAWLDAMLTKFALVLAVLIGLCAAFFTWAQSPPEQTSQLEATGSPQG